MVSAAIATAPKTLKIALERMPFFIRPDLPAAPTGALWSDMIRCHVKANPKSKDLREHANQSELDAAAARFNAGLDVLPAGCKPMAFDFDVEMTSSLDAQRLLLWTGSPDGRRAGGGTVVRETLAEILAREHFSNRGRVSDRSLLVASAAEAGLDAGRAASYLESGLDEEACRRQFLKIMYGWGYDSVPITLFSCEGRHFEIRGSREMKDYVEVLKQIADLPDGNRDARASWETMNDACANAADWLELERKVFSKRDCSGLLKKPGR